MYTIKQVSKVSGQSICNFWSQPITVVSTDQGSFIDHGYNHSKWFKAIGTAIAARVEPCYRNEHYDWIHHG